MTERIVQVDIEKYWVEGVDGLPADKPQFKFVLSVSRYDEYADALRDGLEAAKLLSSAHLGDQP